MAKSVGAGLIVSLSLATFAVANDAPPASTTQEAASESPKSAASEAAPAAEATAAATAVAAADATLRDDPIVCKRVEVTGTRLRKGKVCKPKSEWRQMADDAQSTMKDVDRKSAADPGEMPGG